MYKQMQLQTLTGFFGAGLNNKEQTSCPVQRKPGVRQLVNAGDYGLFLGARQQWHAVEVVHLVLLFFAYASNLPVNLTSCFAIALQRWIIPP